MIDRHICSRTSVAYSAQIACVAGVGGVTLSLLQWTWPPCVTPCGAACSPSVSSRCRGCRAARCPHAAPGWCRSSRLRPPSMSAQATSQTAPAAGVPWLPLVAVLLAGGVAARLLWIAVGLVRLRRLRRRGDAAIASRRSACEELQQPASAPVPRSRFVAGLGQPVTFGLWRPVCAAARRAPRPRAGDSARRGVPRAHPRAAPRLAVGARRRNGPRGRCGFIRPSGGSISRVQLTREEVVDELTVMSTAGRRAYIEALMAFADQPSLAPVAAFGRKHHLFRRVVLLTKEAGMSSRRVLLSSAAVALVVIAGSRVAVGAFPDPGRASGQQWTGTAREPGQAHHAGESHSTPPLRRDAAVPRQRRERRAQCPGRLAHHDRLIRPGRRSAAGECRCEHRGHWGCPESRRARGRDSPDASRSKDRSVRRSRPRCREAVALRGSGRGADNV